ncbi:hypothetical protein KR52_12815 [Synechococcus sp. KORDI-52]|nr:hypothetical protein KR52_12815 [Synechococcus sp. KORDI-52]
MFLEYLQVEAINNSHLMNLLSNGEMKEKS